MTDAMKLADEIEHTWRWEHIDGNGVFQGSLSEDKKRMIITALRAAPQPSDVREALVKSRDLFRLLLKEKKLGVQYAAANQLCHQISAALSTPTPAPAVSGDVREEALAGLVEAVRRDSDEGGKGISGYTSARLSDARAALSAPAGGTGEPVADQIIGQIEQRFPDWKGFRDLVDCIDVTLHRLRGGS